MGRVVQNMIARHYCPEGRLLNGGEYPVQEPACCLTLLGKEIPFSFDVSTELGKSPTGHKKFVKSGGLDLDSSSAPSSATVDKQVTPAL